MKKHNFTVLGNNQLTDQLVDWANRQSHLNVYTSYNDCKEVSSFHFVVLAVQSIPELQSWILDLRRVECPNVKKILILDDGIVVDKSIQHLIREVGFLKTFDGRTMTDDLCQFIGEFSPAVDDTDSVSYYESKFLEALANGSNEEVKQVKDELQDSKDDFEKSFKLLIDIHKYLQNHRFVALYLKKMLARNADNLWAANELGKFYLSQGNAAEGIHLLEQMSNFHDLNPDRMVTLGDAYTKTGNSEKAEERFTRLKDVAGECEEYNKGMAKVSLLNNDLDAALQFLGSESLPRDFVSFLNKRGVISVRNDNVQAGIDLYQQALNGSEQLGGDVKAKLYVNIALAFLKMENFAEARNALHQAAELADSDNKKITRLLKQVENREAETKKKTA